MLKNQSRGITVPPHCKSGPLPLPRTVGWCWGEGGNQDVITIQTSTMIPLSATVSRKCVGVGGWGGTVVTNAFHSYNAKKNLKK